MKTNVCGKGIFGESPCENFDHIKTKQEKYLKTHSYFDKIITQSSIT
jgi:hypothetical protein